MGATMTQPPEPRTIIHRSLSPHSASEDAPRERFPSFDINTPPTFQLPPITESPVDVTSGQPLLSDPKWQFRRTSQKTRDPWHTGPHSHRTRRSVSDALHKFRTRQGSVTDNAQELAEALKAPVSYKLIVGEKKVYFQTPRLTFLGSLYCMVHDLGTHEHILKVDYERISQACDVDHCSIRLGRTMVFSVGFNRISVPFAEKICSST